MKFAGKSFGFPVGASALCWQAYTADSTEPRPSAGVAPSVQASDAVASGGHGGRRAGRSRRSDGATELALGLLHVAALLGVSEAQAALSYRSG